MSKPVPKPVVSVNVNAVRDRNGKKPPRVIAALLEKLMPEVTAAVVAEAGPDGSKADAGLEDRVVKRLKKDHPGAVGSAFIDLILQYLPAIISLILAIIQKQPAPIPAPLPEPVPIPAPSNLED